MCAYDQVQKGEADLDIPRKDQRLVEEYADWDKLTDEGKLQTAQFAAPLLGQRPGAKSKKSKVTEPPKSVLKIGRLATKMAKTLDAPSRKKPTSASGNEEAESEAVVWPVVEIKNYWDEMLDMFKQLEGRKYFSQDITRENIHRHPL